MGWDGVSFALRDRAWDVVIGETPGRMGLVVSVRANSVLIHGRTAFWD